jgi:acyl-coenzyme A synthetase/AMP-(fatty) acid ligase
VGRVDRQVKIRGYRVEPTEVEAALREADAVHDVAVVAVDGRDGLRGRLVAYVVAADPRPSTAALRRVCADRLPAALVPSAFVFVDELPRSASGKVDARYLREVQPGLHRPGAVERLLGRVEAMGATEVEALLRELAPGRFTSTGTGEMV